jgi:hypothetical protein
MDYNMDTIRLESEQQNGITCHVLCSRYDNESLSGLQCPEVLRALAPPFVRLEDLFGFGNILPPLIDLAPEVSTAQFTTFRGRHKATP